MRRAYLGAALVVAGIAALIEAHSHRPETFYPGNTELQVERAIGRFARQGLPPLHRGLSSDAYDLLRIGGWALIVFGIVVAVLGLIAYRAAQTRA